MIRIHLSCPKKIPVPNSRAAGAEAEALPRRAAYGWETWVLGLGFGGLIYICWVVSEMIVRFLRA